MAHEPGHIWRKRRGGREYGSFHTYAAGHIVNLRTSLIDDAKAAAAKLAGAPPATPGTVNSPTVPHFAGGAPTSRPRPLAAWAAGGPAPAPSSPAAPPAPPEPPKLTAAMAGLADGMAAAIAKLNAVTISLACKYLAHVQPGKPDPDDIEDLEKTWSTGLKELMLLHGLQWWHILLAQNGALALSMIQAGTPLPAASVAPIVRKVDIGVAPPQ